MVSETQTIYNDALLWITQAHGDHKYDESLPYVYHLFCVENVLTRFGFPIEKYLHLHLAALCHDAVEDHKAELKDVNKKFGEQVARIVDLVSDLRGLTRQEKHEKTYPLLALNEDAVIIKLADRIANTEYGIATNNLKHYKKYAREFKFFRDTLYNVHHTLTKELWIHLDSLYS